MYYRTLYLVNIRSLRYGWHIVTSLTKFSKNAPIIYKEYFELVLFQFNNHSFQRELCTIKLLDNYKLKTSDLLV